LRFSYFFTYNVNHSFPFTGKVIFNLLDKKIKFSQLYNLHIYRFITFKLPISIEREKYYSATGRDSLCRSNRIAVIVRRFIVIRRLPQEQNYALPRFVMFSRYQAMRFVAKYSWQLSKAAEKKKSIPEVSAFLNKETFHRRSNSRSVSSLTKIGATIKSFTEILTTRVSRRGTPTYPTRRCSSSAICVTRTILETSERELKSDV